MRALAEEHGGRLLVGEAYGMLDEVMLYYGEDLDGFQLPFNFELISAPWDPLHIADFADRYERMIPPGGWPNWVLGNHDRDRIATRVGPDQARVAQMLLLTLRGTPTLWQGDELGMVNEPVPDHMLQDPWAINNPGTGLGRDPARIPMPWQDDAPGRGFTAGEPFLPLSSVAAVRSQHGDPASMLTLVRSLIALRRAEPALALGRYERLHADRAVLAYARQHGSRRLAVALNFTGEGRPLPVRGRARLSTIPGRDLAAVDRLLPNEGVILEQ
jgi:alpha-glucosidase